MCGIVGYVGPENGMEILIEGLKRLEYRGYDSAGIAMIGEGQVLEMVRCQGKIAFLEERLRERPVTGNVGIAHTRWATHGKPCEVNAHPHRSGPFVIVHNGIIENYAHLKHELEQEGFEFFSETDTEVVVKLAEREWRGGKSFEQSVLSSLRQLKGSYALLFLNENNPEELIAACQESPLILGFGENAFYLASDVPAILPYTRKVVYLEDGDIVTISRNHCSIKDIEGKERIREPQMIDWNPVMAEKAGYKHFMLKEIHEQPRSIIDTFRSVLDLNRESILLSDFNLYKQDMEQIEKVYLVACGTSYHACLVGRYMLEKVCRIPVEVDLASEFRYRDPLLNEKTLLLVISQSGETADTKAALREGLDKGAVCRAIVNVVGSSLARMAHGVLYTRSGPEIGVASTKAFTTQLVALYLFGLYWASAMGYMSREDLSVHIRELLKIPGKIDEVLSKSGQIEEWAKRYVHAQDFLYLGRGILYPIALEGALKLKEISYIHAEGYAAGEMKHGPIALIDENVPVVVLLQQGILYEKLLSNVQEAKARGGQVIALVEGTADAKIGLGANQMVIPHVPEWLAPLVFVVPLQLLAYHIAVLRGTDVDQPRNLAKSVTVE